MNKILNNFKFGTFPVVNANRNTRFFSSTNDRGVAQTNKNSTATNPSSLAKKVSLFLIRIIITMVVVIISKSLFFCWYDCTLSWEEFKENIFSFYSGLMAIGILAGGLMNKLLDFTPLNINIKDFLVDPSLKILKKLFLSWKDFVLYQDRNPIQDQPGGSQQVVQTNTPSGSQIQPNTPSSSQVQPIDDRPRRSKKRSHSELEKAVEEAKSRYPKKEGESDESYTKRVKKNESARHSKLMNKTTTSNYRSKEEILNSKEKVKDSIFRHEDESDEAFNKRVSSRELYLNGPGSGGSRKKAGESIEDFEKRVNDRASYFNSTSKRGDGSRKFSSLSNLSKHYFSTLSNHNNKNQLAFQVEDLGKTNFKSYSTYSEAPRNLIPASLAEEKKLNENIFFKRAIYNFIKASIHNLIPGVHFQDSTALITFLKEFDPDFKMSRQSVHNYKKRKLVFNGFLVNTDVSRFLAYVKSRFPEFNPSAFLQKYSGTSMSASSPNMAGGQA